MPAAAGQRIRAQLVVAVLAVAVALVLLCANPVFAHAQDKGRLVASTATLTSSISHSVLLIGADELEDLYLFYGDYAESLAEYQEITWGNIDELEPGAEIIVDDEIPLALAGQTQDDSLFEFILIGFWLAISAGAVVMLARRRATGQ